MKRLPDFTQVRYMLYCLAVLPVFIFRDFTLDNELRYLSIAEEALRNGSLFTFTNHGVLYADKPPLYLWIVMLGKVVFGTHSLVFLGAFSFLPALAIVHRMDGWVKDLLDAELRLVAEMMLLTSAFFIGTALVLRMDMLMCLFIVLALQAFFKMHQGAARPVDSFLFPLYVFMALFTKGPVGLLVPLISTLVFLAIKKELKTLGRYWGLKTLSILLFFCALWFTGVYVEGGRQYLNDLLFNQTLHRAVNAFHHNEPFYYYLLVIWYTLLPWSLLTISILVAGIKNKLAGNDTELFFLVISLSTLVALSLFSAKLAVYLLPAFPFMVYLSVLWLKKLGPAPWTRWPVIIPSLLLCLAVPAVLALGKFDFSITPLLLTSALILSVTGILSVIYLLKRTIGKGIITLCTGLFVSIFLFSFAIPDYNSMIGLGQLCDQAKDLSRQKGGANYYYCKISRADNLDIYLGVEPTRLRVKDLYQEKDSMKKPAILFLSDKYIGKSDSLRQFIKGKKIHRSGNYYCVEVE